MNSQKQNYRIILAEDDPLVAEATRYEVERSGYTVVKIAKDGQEAVRLTKELRPDAVLMDIVMPKMDGITASEIILEQCPTPVIVLSAYDDDPCLQAAIKASVGAYLVKPPASGDIQRAIAIAVARHADLMELRRVNAELRTALLEVKTLRGLLPVCCICKKIRDEDGKWQPIEAFVEEHTQAHFSHTYCPDCMQDAVQESI